MLNAIIGCAGCAYIIIKSTLEMSNTCGKVKSITKKTQIFPILNLKHNDVSITKPPSSFVFYTEN